VHGQNEVKGRSFEHGERGYLYQVQEVFHTIQGEGPFAGKPAVFVRLTGCPLRCWFCDTTWDDEKDPKLSARAVAELIHDELQGARLVVFTGGEPTRFDLTPLLEELDKFDEDLHYQIETAGVYFDEAVVKRPGVTVVVSPKGTNVHKGYFGIPAYWKYIITHGATAPDGYPNKATQRNPKVPMGLAGGSPVRPPETAIEIYLQPCDEDNPVRNRLNMEEAINSAYVTGGRLSVQVHKIARLP